MPAQLEDERVSRRELWTSLRKSGSSILVLSTLGISSTSSARDISPQNLQSYVYSDTWTGTALPWLSLEQAGNATRWDMGRWPDPVLRRSAQTVDPKWFGSLTLSMACKRLQETATHNKAVGLAAQQCGVNARILYLEKPLPKVMVNPIIIARSDEVDIRVWNEECLVLPPEFRATVLRDNWVTLEYREWTGKVHQVRLVGEAARAAQHELDHDRGILVLDHVGLDELESDVMRTIERAGHEERMELAYARSVELPLMPL